MRCRPLKPEDIPILKEFAARSGFPYPDLNHPHIEAVLVIADSDDKPIMAVAAKRLVEIYAWISPEARADLRIESLQMIHEPMARELKGLGYECAEVFIPPQLERRGFGRFLTERFGWQKNWLSWGKRLL